MPILGFYDNGFTITQGPTVATLAQPMSLTPTLTKRVDQYVFRDKTTTTVDVGKEMDRLTVTGLEFYSQSNCQKINAMMDAGQRVYINNLAVLTGAQPDTGYIGLYYITRFTYERKAGVMTKSYYELVLDSET